MCHMLQERGVGAADCLCAACTFIGAQAAPSWSGPHGRFTQASKKAEAEAKAAELARMRAFKASLDAQIAENKARRAASSMSETERRLNAKLLREIEDKGAGAGAEKGAAEAIAAIKL